jgi:DNA-binding LacI/PurR family transcriptional regulator
VQSGRESARRRATIVDVAKAAAVSRQTVSNALNNPERVAPETLERVHREIARLDFTPNAAAQQLRRRRAHAYGFDVDPSGIGGMGPILGEFLGAMTASARDHGSHLVTFASTPATVIEDYERLLSTGLVDGFVIGDTVHGDPRPAWLLEKGVPFVSFGRMWDRPELGRWVDIDGRAGTALAVEHLIEQGYESVAYLGWPSGSPVGDDRRRGWLAGLAAAGLADEPMAEESVPDLAEATAAADRLIDRVQQRGAILCASDTLALGAFRAMRRRGIEPGREVGIVGFDDTEIAVAVELTSLRQPVAEAARDAWELLHSEGTDAELSSLLPPVLVPRASTVLEPLTVATATP